MNLLKSISTLFFILVLCGCNVSDSRKARGLWSEKPANKWVDGLISGNGTMGIIVLGKPDKEQIIFNHEECYEFTGSEDNPAPKLVDYMPEIKRLLKEGQFREADIYSTKMGEKEGWMPVWTDPYHPVLNMSINQKVDGEYKDYSRAINFETGEIIVKWSDNKGSFQRKSFVSKPDNVVVQQLSGNAPVICKIKISDLINAREYNRKLVPDDILLKEPELKVKNDWATYRIEYQLYGRGYESGTKIITKGGSVIAENNELVIKDASEVLILTRVDFLEDYTISNLEHTKNELDLLGDNYDKILAQHEIIQSEIYNRVKLEIYTGAQKSNEALISNQKENPEKIDPAFLETVFNMGRYTLIGSSGKLPPNLSGIWQGDFRPAWCGDFTLDANVNLQIAGAAIGNLYEATDAYMNLLERIAPDWETNAKQFYGCDGYFAGARTSGRRGFANHWGPASSWHFWTSGAQWLLLPAYEYYQTSGDEKFLKERLLPMMKKTVAFYEGFLTEYDMNGDYLFIPSASPENHPGNARETCAAINATIDIAAAREAIVNLITVCRDLNIEQEKIPHWEAMLKKFPPYLISKKSAIKEWATPALTENQAHRHISHLYPVWPGHEIQPDSSPELFEAAKKAIRIRQIGNGSAHGLAHRALICARLKMEEEVYDCLRYLQTEGYFYNGMFSSHNAGPVIFNADLINSFPAIIMESLVYSRPEFIELLPAWSPKLGNGKISGVKCRTNATIQSLEWNFDNMKVEAKLTSGKDQNIKLNCKRGLENVSCNTEYERLSENTISIKIKKGDVITVNYNMSPAVVLYPSEPEIVINDTLQLEHLTLPIDKNEQIHYHSTNTKIAIVDNNGLVKAMAPGSVDIIATSNTGKSGKSKVIVKEFIQPANIELLEDGIVQKNGNLIIKCKYNTETGTKVNNKGIKYSLVKSGKGKFDRTYYAMNDKATAGTSEGKSTGIIPVKDFTPNKDLPSSIFYLLMVIMEDENGNSSIIKKRNLIIE